MTAQTPLRLLATALAALLAFVVEAGATAARSAPETSSGPLLVWSTSELVEETPNHWVDRSTLWLGNADGSRPRILGEGALPELSPDGRWVAFRRDDAVYAVSTAGGRPWLVARGVLPGGWSVDSGSLFSTSGDALYVTDVKARRRVTIDRGATVYGASLSPAGKEIVWARKRGGGSQVEGGVDLFRARIDGTDRSRLTRGGKSSAPLWGPERIAFGRLRNSGDVHFPIYELWAMQREGNGVQRMAQGNQIAIEWSADGRRLLTFTVTKAGTSVNAVDVRSGRTRVLARGNPVFALGLSSDGRYVLASLGGNLVKITWDGRSRTTLARGVDELADWNL